MRDILLAVPWEGFPGEYLAARIHGRKKARAGGTGPSAGREGWAWLQREYWWLFHQMSMALRRYVAPVFALWELRPLALALRAKGGQDRDRAGRLLAASLLLREIKEALYEGEGVAGAIANIEKVLSGFMPEAAGLQAIYEKGRLLAAEERLASLFFHHARSQKGPSPVREYVGHLVDCRNLLAAYKAIRWDAAETPSFMDGGMIAPRVLAGMVRKRDEAGLFRLAGGHEAVVEEEAGIDAVFMKGVARRLAGRARSSELMPLILHHMWTCHARAREQEVLPDEDETQT